MCIVYCTVYRTVHIQWLNYWVNPRTVYLNNVSPPLKRVIYLFFVRFLLFFVPFKHINLYNFSFVSGEQFKLPHLTQYQ